VAILDGGLLPFIPIFEVGETLSNYRTVASITLNDSQGLNGALPYENTSTIASNASASDTYIFTLPLVPEGDWDITTSVYFLGALVENDNTGTPNPTGIFGNMVVPTVNTITGYWAYYRYFGSTALEPSYTTQAEIKSLTKTVNDFSSSPLVYTIPKDTPTTIICAVPTEQEIYISVEGVDVSALGQMTSILHQSLDGVDINDIVVNHPIEKLYTTLDDVSATATKTYSVFVWRTIKGYSKDMDAVITFKPTTGSLFETSTYFDTYYLDEYYTD
jgi:hypothetical protein